VRPEPTAADARVWVERLQPGHPRREQALATLHDVLCRVAVHELGRRRPQLGSIAGPELDDLAQQAADDAMMNILRRLDAFEGRSRFTTWAYKFVVFEVSAKVARHAWRRQAPAADEHAFEQLPDRLTPRPGDRAVQREQLTVLKTAIGELTARQREVFVAIALNDEPIDVLALRLGTNRGAVYKTLFDARRSLRRRLAAAGHAIRPEDARP
jgi:RNA polymerase sigma-70 factor (ECF subfamily)